MASSSLISTDILMCDIVPRPNAYRRVDTECVEFSELCDSIESFGVLTPILVRPIKGDKYEILSGHRRHLASKHLGLSSIPCKILRVKDELAAMIVEFATNALQLDPKPCEYARSVAAIMAKMGHTTTIHALCAAINKNPKWIQSRLTLLKLHPDLQQDVDENLLSIKAGVILSKLSKEMQLKFRNLAKEVTGKQLARLVRDQRVRAAVQQVKRGCIQRQRNYREDFSVRSKKELAKGLDDPYFVEYACSRPFSPDEARVAREVLHWVCKIDPESVKRRQQILDSRRVVDG